MGVVGKFANCCVWETQSVDVSSSIVHLERICSTGFSLDIEYLKIRLLKWTPCFLRNVGSFLLNSAV